MPSLYLVTEDNLCYFCAFLADKGLTHQCYLSAVRHQHVSQGSIDPHFSDIARLEQVLRCIKIVWAKKGEKLEDTPPNYASYTVITKEGVAFRQAQIWFHAIVVLVHSAGTHTNVLCMMMWLLMWTKLVDLNIGQKNSQREHMNHILPCINVSLRENTV